MKFIRMLTFLPLEEIEEMEHWEDSRINEKKEILAYDLTALVHGEQEAMKARETARALFSGKGSDENMLSTMIELPDGAQQGMNILDLLVCCELAGSRSEARRLVVQGGISLDEEKVSSPEFEVEVNRLSEGVVIRKGKKVFHRAVLNPDNV